MFGGFAVSAGAALKSGMQTIVNQRRAESQVDKIGSRGWDMALSMVGNAGQLVLVTAIGEAGFQEAAQMDFNEEQEAGETLLQMSSHPEAIEEILMEVGAGITEECQELKAKEGEEAQAGE